MDENHFTLLIETQYSSEAMIYKGKLESEGISGFLQDNFLVDSMPLYSNAVGGVKIYVRNEDAEAAKKVMSDISRFSVDNTGKRIVCPNCQSEEVDLVTTVKDAKSLLSFLFSAGLFATLPFYTKYKYKCNACGFEFEQKK